MALGVPAYLVPNVRVRGMVGRLLSDREWTELDRTRDMDGFVQRLRQTGYGERLEELEHGCPSCEALETRLNADAAASYTRVSRVIPSSDRPLIHLLRQSYQVDNLKTVLRGISVGEDRTKLESFLVPLDDPTDLDCSSLLESADVPEVIHRSRDSVFGPALAQALPRYRAEGRLFALEVALDLDYYRRLWRAIESLRGSSSKWARRVIGPWFDQTNVIWALRYRHYHRLSVAEIINYTLPYGHRCTDQHIRALAEGSDVGGVLAAIWGARAPTVETDQEGWLPRLEVQLHRLLAGRSRTALQGYPFHLGVTLAFLILKKFEIQDLMVLAEAKSSGMPRQAHHPYMVHQIHQTRRSRV